MKLKTESSNKPKIERHKCNFKRKYCEKAVGKEYKNNILKNVKNNGNIDIPKQSSILDKWLVQIYSKNRKKPEETAIAQISNELEKKAPEIIIKLERLNIQLRNGEYIIQSNKDQAKFTNNNIEEIKVQKKKECINRFMPYEKDYKCPQCPFETKQKYYFNSHVKGHQKRQMEKCPYCKKDIKWFSFKMHLKTHERNDKTEAKCNLCNYRSYNGANVKRHMLIHKDLNELETFECDLCNFISISKDRLKSHKIMVHTKEGKWKKCEICDYSTRRTGHIVRHMLTHTRTSVQCTECFKFYVNEKLLETHVKKMHISDVEKRYFYCDLCPKGESYRTTEKGNLARHMLTHRTKKELELYSCHKCPYLGKSKCALKAHFISQHMPQLHRFKCSDCPYTTPLRSRFNLHYRLVHRTKKRNYTLPQRDKAKCRKETSESDYQYSTTNDEQSISGDEEVDVGNDTDDDKPSKSKNSISKNNDATNIENKDEFKSKLKLSTVMGRSKIKQQN